MMILRQMRYMIIWFALVLVLTGCQGTDKDLIQVGKPTRSLFKNNSHFRSITDSQVWDLLSKLKANEKRIRTSDIQLFPGKNSKVVAKKIMQQGFVPIGRNCPPWPIDFPIDWGADPFDDRNWRFHVQAWRMIDPMLVTWNSTGDEQFVRDALAIVKDWYDYHVVRGKKSTLQWYDMAIGLRASKLAYLLDGALRGDFTLDNADRKILLQLAHLHAVQLMDPKKLSRGNHDFFVLHGLMALCSTNGDLDSCNDYNQYVERELTNLLNEQFSDEGLHLESSPSYHFFVFNTVKKLLNSGWYNDFENFTTLVKKADMNRKWMVHPDKTIITVGDSEPDGVNLDWPQGSEQCRDSDTLTTECVLVQKFLETGYAIIRSDWSIPKDRASMLFFTGSFHNTGHKLPDDLSFEWYDKGARIILNSGKYSYNKDEWREFVEHTRAHNTVEIDQESYSTERAGIYGSALKGAGWNQDVVTLSGVVSHKRLKTVHHRVIHYRPSRWLIVADSMRSKKSRNYTQWFHFSPDVSVYSTHGKTHGILKNKSKFRIDHFPEIKSVKLVRGQKTPRIQGWSTLDYGKMEQRYALGFSHAGEEVEMRTIFSFSEEDYKSALKFLSTL